MRVLVTGGAGFIGSHVVDYLIQQGDEVSVIDDLSTGSLRNIRHLQDNPNFRFSNASVLDAQAVDAEISQVDVVYHLAAAPGAQLIVDSPLQPLITNITAPEHGSDPAHTSRTKII